MAEKAIRLGGESTADAIVSAVDTMYSEHTFDEKDFVLKHNDDEIAVINRGESLHVFNMDNKESKVNIQKLRMSISELEKGGYPHFMLKEIFEQPRTLRDCIRGRVSADGKHVVLSGVLDNKERFLDAHRILIVACGTSWHAALIGKHLGDRKIAGSMDFADMLLENANVALTPGTAFCAEGYCRISYATSMEQIDKGVDRIEHFVNSLV